MKWIICLLWLTIIASRGALAAGDFYAPPPDPGERLPVAGIYPQGRRLAFMGYSGEPARDLTNGFTVAGPVYGNQSAYLARCASNGWPVVAHVGLQLNFLDPKSASTLPTPAVLKQQIQSQVQSFAADQAIVWWAVTPEELRPWSRTEMDYLENVCAAIRENDPRRRPIYLYNPNHRDTQTLAPIARQVDIVAKGCYVNTTGHKQDRVWVRWSVEQEIAAIQAAGQPGAMPLLNPELCKDPEPAEDSEIRAWVRHDVYLGLSSGAKGVLIWSLFPRQAVRRTWPLWYDAYAECGRELNGRQALAQVFLFGERRADLKVRLVEGEAVSHLTLGGKVESGTTSESERAARAANLPTWYSAEFAYGKSRWLFVINSANSPARFDVSGWPRVSRAEDAFTGVVIPLEDAGELTIDLNRYGVFGLRLSSRR